MKLWIWIGSFINTIIVYRWGRVITLSSNIRIKLNLHSIISSTKTEESFVIRSANNSNILQTLHDSCFLFNNTFFKFQNLICLFKNKTTLISIFCVCFFLSCGFFHVLVCLLSECFFHPDYLGSFFCFFLSFFFFFFVGLIFFCVVAPNFIGFFFSFQLGLPFCLYSSIMDF